MAMTRRHHHRAGRASIALLLTGLAVGPLATPTALGVPPPKTTLTASNTRLTSDGRVSVGGILLQPGDYQIKPVSKLYESSGCYYDPAKCVDSRVRITATGPRHTGSVVLEAITTPPKVSSVSVWDAVRNAAGRHQYQVTVKWSRGSLPTGSGNSGFRVVVDVAGQDCGVTKEVTASTSTTVLTTLWCSKLKPGTKVTARIAAVRYLVGLGTRDWARDRYLSTVQHVGGPLTVKTG